MEVGVLLPALLEVFLELGGVLVVFGARLGVVCERGDLGAGEGSLVDLELRGSHDLEDRALAPRRRALALRRFRRALRR